MEGLFDQKNKRSLDTRKRRRLFRIVKKIQRISAVVLAWLAFAAILYGAYSVIVLKPYFKVANIEVKGDLTSLTSDNIIEQSGIRTGDHLLRIPVSQVQKKLVENPWIKEAAVHRKFPHMVWIYIKEYQPEAIIRGDGWYYIDRNGVSFKKLTLNDERDFPIITGLEGEGFDGKNDALSSKLVEFLNVKKIFENSRFGEIYGLSEIHYNRNRGVSIITMNDPMELRLGFGPLLPRLLLLLVFLSVNCLLIYNLVLTSLKQLKTQKLK